MWFLQEKVVESNLWNHLILCQSHADNHKNPRPACPQESGRRVPHPLAVSRGGRFSGSSNRFQAPPSPQSRGLVPTCPGGLYRHAVDRDGAPLTPKAGPPAGHRSALQVKARPAPPNPPEWRTTHLCAFAGSGRATRRRAVIRIPLCGRIICSRFSRLPKSHCRPFASANRTWPALRVTARQSCHSERNAS